MGWSHTGTASTGGGARRRAGVAGLVVLALAAGCSYSAADLDVADPVLDQSSKIFAADGRLITTLLASENRENVRLDELPAHVADAVVAIEDARFWTHRGVDVKAVIRAAVANTAQGEVVEGGSTITQQYVKNTLLDDSQTLHRKAHEAILALRLERRYTKQRILELYLNTIFFGNGAYGIQAAAQEYFGVRAQDLTLAQSATLAGLIRAPSAFDPTDAPEAARGRRDRVITRMGELGLVTEPSAAAATAEDLVLAERTVEERYPAAHFVEQVKRFVLDDESGRFGATRTERRALLFGGGLQITTTLDLDLQAAAEEAVALTLPDPPAFPEAALVSLEPASGYVRALVGGRDFFGGGAQAKVDLAAGGPGRPSGSSFKPFVLAAALAEGIPLDRVYPAPSRIEIPLPEGPWQVENYEGGGGGEADLVEATIRSYNTVYAQLIRDVGPEDAMAMANNLGVDADLPPYYSAVLGTNLVQPLDMAAGYATLANRGLRVAPAFVAEVTRRDGTVLYRHRHAQTRVVDTRIADQVTDVLQRVVEDGTGVRAAIGRPVAGKTGTGQEWRDAWFVGYTPQLVTAVWMGYAEEGRRSMVPPATPFPVTGGTWSASIWQLYTSKALTTVPVVAFPEPPPPPPAARPEIIGVDLSQPRIRNVVGLGAAAAGELLLADGFTVVQQDVTSDEYPPGVVVNQTPAAGARTPTGGAVVLGVASGAAQVATVPDVLGRDEAGTVRTLSEAALAADIQRDPEPPSPGVEARAGLAWKQFPAAGSVRAQGSRVRVWINP